MSQKQFFLRRITHLSLNLFGTLALLSRIEAARQRGRNVAAELLLLDFFVAEAKHARKGDSLRSSFRRERLHAKIFAGLRRPQPEKAAGRKPEKEAMPVVSSAEQRVQKA